MDWFMQHNPETAILGRPTKSLHPAEYQRLKALLRYHQKADNMERVEEIKAQLIVLETGMASEEDSPAEEHHTGKNFAEQKADIDEAIRKQNEKAKNSPDS